MNNFILFIVGLLIANLSWFIIFWKDYPYFDFIIPKYITSSYDPNLTTELDSVLLKSLEKYIGKYFNKYNQSIHLNEGFNTYIKDELKVTNSTKISLFLDENKENILILKINNEIQTNMGFDNRAGEVSLYTTPLYGYKDKTLQDGHNYKVLIKKCWTSNFFGKIMGAVTSNDKSQLSVFYRIIEGHNVSFRIRFFHDIACGNKQIAKSDSLLKEQFKEPGNKTTEADNELYYEIHENEQRNEDSNLQTTDLLNYFDDNSFDDVRIRGNTPITSMAIKANTIAYARDYDYKPFYILKRDASSTARFWKVSFMGSSVDRAVHPFHHINSLKFLNDKLNDYKLMNIATLMNNTGIFGKVTIVEANNTDYSNAGNTTYYQVLSYTKPLTNKIIPDGSKFELEKSIKELKRFMKQTVFSNNKEDNILFELDAGALYSLSWDNATDTTYYLNSLHINEKVSKIISDSKNEYIVIKPENSKDLKLIYRDLVDTEGSFQSFDIAKTSTIKSLPKKYREKEGLGYLIENIDNKM
jgi:hypothetical protein